MKNLLFLVLSFLALALFTTACEKSTADYSPRSGKVSRQNAVTDGNVGEQHNAGLDYFLQNADFHDGLNQIEPLTLKFGESLGYNYDEMSKTLADPQVSAVIHSDSPENALREQYIANGQKQELAYFNQLEAIIIKASTAEEAIQNLNALGEKIASDESLSEKSQTTLLNGLEVGKHSADYWYRESLKGEASPWAKKKAEGTGVDTSRHINWGVVVVHDVIGFLKGGWPGAVVCSLISIWEQWP